MINNRNSDMGALDRGLIDHRFEYNYAYYNQGYKKKHWKFGQRTENYTN